MPNLRQHPVAARAPTGRPTSSPSTWIEPASGVQQAEDALQQHRLAGARAADHDQRFAGADLQVERRRARPCCRRPCAGRGSGSRRLAAGGSPGRGSSGEEQLGDEVVEATGSGSRPRPRRWWSPCRRPGRRRLRIVAVVAAHQRDDEAEDRRLDQAGDDVLEAPGSRRCSSGRCRG